MLILVSLVLLAVILPPYAGNCQPVGDNSIQKRFNFMDGVPCMQMCSAECGGICFFNTLTFTHECNCAFKRSIG